MTNETKVRTLGDMIRQVEAEAETENIPWTVRLEFKLRSPLSYRLLRGSVDDVLVEAARKIIAVAGWGEGSISTSVFKEPKACRD